MNRKKLSGRGELKVQQQSVDRIRGSSFTFSFKKWFFLVRKSQYWRKKMGRNQKPTATKNANGNKAHQSKIKNEPLPKKKIKKPARFKILEPVLNKFWDWLTPELVEIDLLTEIDRMAYLLMLMSYDIATEARAEIKSGKGYILTRKDENGVERKAPQLQIFRDQSAQFLSFAREFGLTPASRGKIGTDLDARDSAIQEMMDLLTGKKTA